MTLEATYICIDNSECMRNGDFAPTRLASVTDACNVLCSQKTNMNPENGVGFLTMANERVNIVETLTQDLGRLISALTNLTTGGKLNLIQGLQVGQLGLKHRMNKNQRQRIVAFIGSKVDNTEKELVMLAKRLKKNSVSVDIVCFGCDENIPLLEKFIETVNSKQQDKDTSHLLVVQEGQSVADTMCSSAIINPDGPPSGGGSMFDVDPNLDPELAMVLRMSMEEERARQERNRAEQGGDPSQSAPPETQAATETAPAPTTEDEVLAMAMKMSLDEANQAEKAAEGNSGQEPMEMDEDMDEEAQMAMALKLSMQNNTDPEYDAMMDDENLTAEMAADLGIDVKKNEKPDGDGKQ
eukprot:TRINITY_DN2042_c1_g3_i1.p1 TRINITY_DN2042_c1_g3~~TRINITY_DN2042_c1_g3_i1.p1  ORF type:complete len:379 (+),score=103.78 TRINITY_DN2042_c1_g3_i1:77-1138(+)